MSEPKADEASKPDVVKPEVVRPTIGADGCTNKDGSGNQVTQHAANAAEFNALCKHDGRGLHFLSLLLRWHGSIIPRTMPVALFSATIAIILMVFEKQRVVDPSWMPILKHPIAIQIFGVVLGYVVVLRSNVAVERYYEGITHVQFFGSKWIDAYTQLCGFMRSSAKIHMRENRMHLVTELQELQLELLHYFTLLHGLAINSLQITQMDLEDEEYFKRVQSRPKPVLNFMKLQAADGKGVVQVGGVSTGAGKRSLKKASIGDLTPEIEEMLGIQKGHVKSHGLRPLGLIGALTDEEEHALKSSEDKVDLVHSWIIEAISQASLDQVLLTQAPILSRVYQELSNGMLGYNQSYKIALIQFPFAFAQILTLFLLAFLFCCPVAAYVFVGGQVLTPVLAFLTILGFWGIHEIAVEVENPFGVTPNQLPMKPLHDSICEALFEACTATLPIKRSTLEATEAQPPQMQG